MAFSNILFLSTTLLLAFFNLSSGNPALDQANATVSAVNKTNALEGAHHVLRLGGNGSALNHDIQSSYIYCSSNSYCWSNTGYGSSCYNGKCICDIGYHSSLGKCVQTSCTFDTDCSVYQYNTRCNINDRCVCKYGTYLDSTSQTCKYNYYPSSGGGAGETVGFSFGGFIFLIIVISLCVLCCRNRRQRIVRVVGPNVQQQQPRPGFVQPQPGYAYQQQQGYQQGYQQQQQQQPMPMPQPSAYPNPNYQQQQVQQQQAPPPPYNPAFAASPSGYPSIGGKV